MKNELLPCQNTITPHGRRRGDLVKGKCNCTPGQLEVLLSDAIANQRKYCRQRITETFSYGLLTSVFRESN
ncbi:MAG: hypothetical protein AB4063_10060 [Crocosphaera sp.]